MISRIILDSLPCRLGLMRDGWRECASVTSGGKPFFYFKAGGPGEPRQWIVWNRTVQKWTREIEEFSDSLAIPG